jgi:hypothetical protein
MLAAVSERQPDPGQSIADEITVGEWLDEDPPPPEQALSPEPAPARPGLWARLTRALRGTP